jgi:hypothetical protein
VPFEDKRFGRIAAIDHVVKSLSKGMNLAWPPLPPEIAEAAAKLFTRIESGGKKMPAVKK